MLKRKEKESREGRMTVKNIKHMKGEEERIKLDMWICEQQRKGGERLR